MYTMYRKPNLYIYIYMYIHMLYIYIHILHTHKPLFAGYQSSAGMRCYQQIFRHFLVTAQRNYGDAKRRFPYSMVVLMEHPQINRMILGYSHDL